MVEGVIRSLSFFLAYMKNVEFSTTTTPLHHATDVSIVVESVMMGEKIIT